MQTFTKPFVSYAPNCYVAMVVLSWLMTANQLSANPFKEGLEGRYVTIVSDSINEDNRARLIETLDQAVPLWAERLGVATARLADFHFTAYVFSSRERMLESSILPLSLPRFLNGIQVANQAWLIRQKSDYATAHLLLHEGVHTFMFWAFGQVGAGWFSEGFAEYFATHVWQDGSLQVGVIPQSRETSSYWGRIGLLKQARIERRVPSIERIMSYQSSPTAELETYAWCWAFVAMLDMYPEYRQIWQDSLQDVALAEQAFNSNFKQRLQTGWDELNQRWRVWSWELDYGYDVERQQLPPISSVARPRSADSFMIASNVGWQPMLIGIARNATLQFDSSGQVSLANEPKPWISESDGVTLAYHNGLPLGELQATMLDSPAAQDGWVAPLDVISIGSTRELTVTGGVLLLRVNDFPDQRIDNRGAFKVKISLK